MIKATIIGATGRMGQALIRAAREQSDIRIVAAVASQASGHIGRDAGQLADEKPLGVPVTHDLRASLAGCDVAIDFSQPSATAANLAACSAAKKPLLMGTTGFSGEVARNFNHAARNIPLLIAPNTSIGVTLLVELVRACARALPAEFDIDILEVHHRHKQDAPSGTALALGRAAAGARGVDLDEAAVKNRAERKSATPRREGEIGFASLRSGDIVGEHTVMFSAPGEQVLLTHRALDRTIFARGALKAAAWLAAQPPGLYRMQDVLGYKSGT